MNLPEFKSVLIQSESGGVRSATPRKAYDDRAGSTLLRRAGKSGAAVTPLRGDQGLTILAARRKIETEDRLAGQLREFYQAMLSEPVPERLIELIESLKEQDR